MKTSENLVNEKNGRFYLRKVFEGKQQSVPLGKNKKTAEERARKFLLLAERDGYESARADLDGKPCVKAGGNPTFEEMELLYRDFCKTTGAPREASIKLNLDRLKLFMKRAGVQRVGQLDKNKLFAAWFGDKTPDQSGKRTFSSAVAAASSVFTVHALEYYASRKVPVKNPFKGIKKEKPKAQPYVPFSAELGKRLFDDCQTELPTPDAMMVLMAQFIGMRLSEVEAAIPAWFSLRDKETAIAHIQETKNFTPKNGQSGVVPFDRKIYDLLLKLRGDTDSTFFVPNNSKKTGDGRLAERSKAVNVWLKKKGITNAKPFHGLRKQFGSIIYLKHGLLQTAALLRNTVAVCSEYYAGLSETPTAMIAASFEKPETPEEAFAKSLGITVEKLREKLGQEAS
jgi:integrase